MKKYILLLLLILIGCQQKEFNGDGTINLSINPLLEKYQKEGLIHKLDIAKAAVYVDAGKWIALNKADKIKLSAECVKELKRSWDDMTFLLRIIDSNLNELAYYDPEIGLKEDFSTIFE